MKILAVDTSTKNLNIAIYLYGQVAGAYLEKPINTHSEILLANIDNQLRRSNLALSDFDYFCCCVGPGSFTGIRIGVCTIKTFAQSFNKKVITVNSNELYAYNERDKEGYVISVLNAMNNKLYYAVYNNGSEIVKPSICEIDEFKDIINKYKGEIVSDILPSLKDFEFCNDGPTGVFKTNNANSADIKTVENLDKFTIFANSAKFKSVRGIDRINNLANLAYQKVLEKKAVDFQKVEPLYVRLSSAEEKFGVR